jgi:hypothetical protein
MRKTFWLLVGLPVAIVYTIKFIGTLKDRWWPTLQIEARYGFIFLVFVCLCIYAYNIFLTINHSRNSKYGAALNTITSGFANIHELNRYNEQQLTADMIRQHLKDMCTNISYAFTIICGYKVACCIKIMTPTEEKSNYLLKTLCRDNHDGVTRGKPDFRADHFLNVNSDFKTLFNDIRTGKSRFFISNRINWLYDYENSSFESYGGKIRMTGNSIFDFFILAKQTLWWPLPYKSTIIVPIIPVNYKPTDEILGFLCVDSRNMFVFKRYYDVDLLIGLADGIYNTVNQMHSLTKT